MTTGLCRFQRDTDESGGAEVAAEVAADKDLYQEHNAAVVAELRPAPGGSPAGGDRNYRRAGEETASRGRVERPSEVAEGQVGQRTVVASAGDRLLRADAAAIWRAAAKSRRRAKRYEGGKGDECWREGGRGREGGTGSL